MKFFLDHRGSGVWGVGCGVWGVECGVWGEVECGGKWGSRVWGVGCGGKWGSGVVEHLDEISLNP
jgi:hypothetical protein